MNTEFWLDNWKNNKIGFHQQAVNPYLTAFWRQLNIPPDSGVFVPLCGKSLDLVWLNRQGHCVIGVEVSELAVSQFFSENGLKYNLSEQDGFYRYKSDRLVLWQGDFLNLRPEHLHDVAAVYDRATLVALPAELRQKYVKHLIGILPAKVKILLVGFEYEQAEMAGPPFSVEEAEVRMLFQANFDIKVLQSQDALENYPAFRDRGLSKLIEKVYLLTSWASPI